MLKLKCLISWIAATIEYASTARVATALSETCKKHRSVGSMVYMHKAYPPVKSNDLSGSSISRLKHQ
ncbi:MAG: hypothetical protein ACTS73_05440 [Arsenophonus sp. NEOnobi-MAG3]